MDKAKILKAILETPYPLFEQQRAAVTSQKRHVRIVAGAGAGKTETLTRRIAYLLLYQEEQPSSISSIYLYRPSRPEHEKPRLSKSSPI